MSDIITPTKQEFSKFDINGPDGQWLIQMFRLGELDKYSSQKQFYDENKHWQKYKLRTDFFKAWDKCRTESEKLEKEEKIDAATAKIRHGKRMREDSLEERKPAAKLSVPNHDDSLDDKKLAAESLTLAAGNHSSEFDWVPWHDKVIEPHDSARNKVILLIELASGTAVPTSNELSYYIEESDDGSESVLVVKVDLLSPLAQNPSRARAAFVRAPDFSDGLQALEGHRTTTNIVMKKVAHFKLGIKVPPIIQSEWVSFVTDTSGVQFLLFVIPEFLDQPTA